MYMYTCTAGNLVNSYSPKIKLNNFELSCACSWPQIYHIKISQSPKIIAIFSKLFLCLQNY